MPTNTFKVAILQKNSEEYQYPVEYDLSQALTEVGVISGDTVTQLTNTVNSLITTGDILTAQDTINNNVSTATNINALLFPPASVRAAIVEFTVYRVTGNADGQERVEVGTAYITYKNSGSIFELTVVGSGGSGVTLSIDSNGQVKYTSDLMPGSNHAGKITFRARGFGV